MSMSDLKHQELPLARIKKIMKLDDDVKVYSQSISQLFDGLREFRYNELLKIYYRQTPIVYTLFSENRIFI
jgi:hypothetical protein